MAHSRTRIDVRPEGPRVSRQWPGWVPVWTRNDHRSGGALNLRVGIEDVQGDRAINGGRLDRRRPADGGSRCHGQFARFRRDAEFRPGPKRASAPGGTRLEQTGSLLPKRAGCPAPEEPPPQELSSPAWRPPPPAALPAEGRRHPGHGRCPRPSGISPRAFGVPPRISPPITCLSGLNAQPSHGRGCIGGAAADAAHPISDARPARPVRIPGAAPIRSLNQSDGSIPEPPFRAADPGVRSTGAAWTGSLHCRVSSIIFSLLTHGFIVPHELALRLTANAGQDGPYEY